MNEDDTFRRLARVPFRQVFVECVQGITLGDDVIAKNWKLIESSGWAPEEFRSKMLSEMIAKRITLDAAIVTDGEWQKEYLKSGAI